MLTPNQEGFLIDLLFFCDPQSWWVKALFWMEDEGFGIVFVIIFHGILVEGDL